MTPRSLLHMGRGFQNLALLYTIHLQLMKLLPIYKKSNSRSTTLLGAETNIESAEEAVCCFTLTYIIYEEA